MAASARVIQGALDRQQRHELSVVGITVGAEAAV
jgi:hypothetical protein